MANLEVLAKIEGLVEQVAQKEKINNYDITVRDQGQLKDGFLSDMFFASITNRDTENVLHLAIKRAFEKTSEAFEDSLSMAFQNEILFYDKVVPVFEKLQEAVKEPLNSFAKCYLSQKDIIPNYLVFDDITKKGFELFDKRKTFPSDHLEMIFKRYAKFHALSFVLKKKNLEEFQNISRGFLEPMKKIMDKTEKEKMGIQMVEQLIQMFDPVQEKEFYNATYEYCTTKMQHFEDTLLYKGNYSCILHGDCWSNNMMFKYDKDGKLEDMRILDFQICKESTPVYDLSYFFYTSADKEDQDKLLSHYLKLYHSHFSKFVIELGEDPEELFPFEALINDWKLYGIIGFMFAVMVTKIKLTEKKGIQEMYDGAEVSDMQLDKMFNADYDKVEYIRRIKNLIKHLCSIDAF